MICDHCLGRLERVSGSVKDQITARGDNWIMVRCHNCGQEMLLLQTRSSLAKQYQRTREDFIRNSFRELRHQGHDLDADQEAEEDREIEERRRAEDAGRL